MKKHFKIYIIIAVILVFALLLWILSGCTFTKELLTRLGFDMHDYESETVIAAHAADSEIAVSISDMVHTLTLNNPEIPCFDGTKQAVSLCRDSLLNYMLNNNYAKYAGNLSLLDLASKEYPYLNISTVIPEKDFEDAAYRYFGGKQKIANESGQLFTYLDKVKAYTTVSAPVDCTFEVICEKLEETDKTYRCNFFCRSDSMTSDKYFTLIIKRDDQSCYFKYIKKAADVRK